MGARAYGIGLKKMANPYNEQNADMEVDASGLKCPLPILRAKKALAQLQSGQLLKVITTDTHALRDFQAFAKQTGNVLEAQIESEASIAHFLRRR